MASPNEFPLSPIDEVADEALVPTSERLALTVNIANTANNYHIDFSTFRTPHPVIVEILRGHPLYFALTATVRVPEIYVQQFWRSSTLILSDGLEMIVGNVDTSELTLTCADLRSVLHLPEANAGGRTGFDPLLSDAQVFREIMDLGYNGDIPHSSKFRRGKLQPIWYTLYSILSRCLSSKTKGIDQCTTSFIHIFHAVAYGRNVDFAQLLWMDIARDVQNRLDNKKGRRRTTIPFMRFFEIVIRDHMDSTPAIRQRRGNPTIPPNAMGFLQPHSSHSEIHTLAIPAAVLELADPSAQSVIEYRNSVAVGVARTDRPEPAGPTPRVQPSRERPHTLSSGSRQAQGASERVFRVRVKGHGVGSIVGASGSAHQPSFGAFAITDSRIITRPPSPLPQAPPSRISSPRPRTPLHLSAPTPSPQRQSPRDQTDRTVNDAPQEPSDGSPSSSSRIDTSESTETATHGNSTESEGEEGEYEEDVSVLERVRTSGLRPGLGMGKVGLERIIQSASVSVPTPSDSRAATSATDLRESQVGIEGATVRPTVHLHTPPSHSTVSQQTVVSVSHGVLAHTLPASHSEMAGIDTREQLPPLLPSLVAHRVLEPFVIAPSVPSLIRTQSTAPSALSLSGSAGTTIASSSLSVMQGLVGSPVTANIMPAVITGGFASFATGGSSTGSQSGPGVSLPEFVSKEFLDSALKAVQEGIREELRADREKVSAELNEIRRLLKGKEKVTDNPPPIFTPPPERPPPLPTLSPYLDDLSTEDLKVALLNRLLMESEVDIPADREVDLIGLLRMQTAPPSLSPSSDIAELQRVIDVQAEQLRQRDEQIAIMRAQLAALQETCSAQARGTKRGHDDQDDPDGHEGEKRQRFDSSTATDLATPTDATNDDIQLEVDSQADTQELNLEPLTDTEEFPLDPLTDVDEDLFSTDEFLDLNQPDDSIFLVQVPEASMDVGPTVEKPAGGNTDGRKPDMEENTDDWPVIDLSAPTAEAANLEINEDARRLLQQLASSYALQDITDPGMSLSDYDQIIPSGSSSAAVPPSMSSGPPVTTSRVDDSSDPPTFSAASIPAVPLLLWDHTFILKPFLEESSWRIFRKTIHKFSDAVRYGVSHLKPIRRQTEYVHSRRNNIYGNKRVKRNFLGVLRIEPRWYQRHSFSEFFVQIDNPKCFDDMFFTFWEADLDSLDLEDLLALIRDLRSEHRLRPPNWINGLEALKRYVRHSINLARIEDYQMGIENRAMKVNLLAPDFRHPTIDSVPLYSPVGTPESGIVYLNRKKKRRFMRFSQLSSFCDGTLLYVRNALIHRLETKTFTTSNKYAIEEKLVQSAVEKIEEKLKERMIYRRVEMALKLRKKTITTWEEFLHLSKSQRELSKPPPF